MLGDSSSEGEEDDYTPGRSDPDDAQSVILSIPPDRTSTRKPSVRSVSPSHSSYSCTTPTPSVRGGTHDSFSGSIGGGQQNHVDKRVSRGPERSVSSARPPSPSDSEQSVTVSVSDSKCPAPLPKMSKEEQERDFA